MNLKLMTFIIVTAIVVILTSNQFTVTIPPTSMFWYVDKIKDRIDISLSKTDEKTKEIMDVADERISEIKELDKNKKENKSFNNMKRVLDEYGWTIKKISDNWENIDDKDKAMVKEELEEYYKIIFDITKNKSKDILEIMEKITALTLHTIKKLNGINYPNQDQLSSYVNNLNKKITLNDKKNESFLLQIRNKNKIKKIYEIVIMNGKIKTISEIATDSDFMIIKDEKELIESNNSIESAILSVINSAS